MTTTHRSLIGPDFTPPPGITSLPFAEYLARFPSEYGFLISRLLADAPPDYVVDEDKVRAVIQLMAEHGHIQFGVTEDGRPHYSLVDPDSVVVSDEERAALKALLKLANMEGGVALPPDAQPLTMLEFERRFTPILMADLERHVATTLAMPQADMHELLEMASRGGPGQVVQFALVRGTEPAVFCAPSAALSPEGRRFTDAVVSYWDTQGTYRATTGEAATAMEALFERVLDARRQMLLHKGFEDLKQTPVGTQLTVAWLAVQLGLNVADLFANYVVWRKANPETDASEHFDTLIPEDRREQMVKDSQEFTDYVGTGYAAKRIEVQDEEIAGEADRLSQYADTFEHTISAHLVAMKAKTDTLEREWEAVRDTPGGPVVAHAARLQEIKAQLEVAQHDLRKLGDFMKADRDVHLQAATALEGSETKTSVFIEAYELVAREYPDDTPAQLTARTIRALRVEPGTPVRKVGGTEPATLDEWINGEHPNAISRLVEEVSASPSRVREILDRWVNAGVLYFVKLPQHGGHERPVLAGVLPNGWPEPTSRTERLMQQVFSTAFNVRSPVTGASTVEATVVTDDSWMRHSAHAYMRAVEAQYAVLADMIYAANKAKADGTTSISGMSVSELFEDDIAGLKRAETYCWFEEPIMAVEAAAATLPDTVRLTRDLTEHWAAWWYFTMPQDVKTLPTSEMVQALLWSWDGPRLRFSTYVRDTGEFGPKGGPTMPSGLWPTAKFSWHEGETLAMALRRCREEHRERYAAYTSPRAAARVPTALALTPEEVTFTAIERLLRFFIAGSLWVQQTILVRSKGHVERHVRKRIEKQRNIGLPLGDVQIVHLRRKESVAEPALRAGDEKFIDWKCRWVVRGFWRNQWYPSTGAHQPKWVDPYVKGPADRPLRVHTHRINVVNR